MNEEYQKGQEIGAIKAEILELRRDVQEYAQEQRAWNKIMEARVAIAEQWIQTTTGKVVVVTTIFGIVGSACYVFINWALNHWLK
jgi:hypothetical protein